MTDRAFELPTFDETGSTREGLLDALKRAAAVPAYELAAATLYAEEIEQAVIDVLERARLEDLDLPSERLLFRGIHILGGRRRPAAYRPLIAFLRGPQKRVDHLLGDAMTETLARILAGLFDGDPAPLLALIADGAVDEFIREAALKTLAFLTFDGRIEQAFAEDFLTRFEQESTAPAGDMIWHGWMTAVALLGLERLSPRVHVAFEDERIPDWVAGENHYQELLAAALERPADPARFEDEGVGYIEDVVELLEGLFFDEQADSTLAAASDDDLTWQPPFLPPGMPARNPWRDIGRNDPCPCGSGKKFKKCCLA